MEFIKIIHELWGRQNLKKVITNVSWLTFDTFFNLLVALFIGIWFARYLGPEQYGLYNYALAIIGLVAVFSGMGLNDILIREIVKNPSQKYIYIGSAFGLTLIGGIGAYLIAIAAVSVLEPANSIGRLLVSIMGLQLLFYSFGVINTWFASQVESKKMVLVRSISLLVVSGLKVYLIITEAPLIYFAWLVALGAVFTAVLSIMVYRLSREEILKWHFRLDYAKALLKDSWPLIFAGLSISVYMKIDQVMVGNILRENALGNYSAAVKLSEVWHFIPMVFVHSFYPSLIKYKQLDEKLYLKRLQILYYLMTWLAIAVASITTILSPYLIQLTFGSQFSDASGILRIYVWTAIPVFLGGASNSYLMIENLTKVALMRTSIGAAINILLNLILIPLMGLYGAALATLISYNFAVFSIIISKQTRNQSIMILNSLKIWNFKKYNGRV